MSLTESGEKPVGRATAWSRGDVLLLSALFFYCTCTAAAPQVGYSVDVENSFLQGRIHDNVSNAEYSGSGFRPLQLRAFPEQNLFHEDYVGLNFEHIFNGTAADKDLAMFTPRKDRCWLEVHDEASVTIHWPAEESAWAMECSMRYTLHDRGVDLAFNATPTAPRFPLGYVAMMWASYMGRTRERPLHFYGVENGVEQWLRLGEETRDGFETGTVAHASIEPLAHEAGAQTLNLIEHPAKRFLRPFYYGLIDADGDLETANDTRAYVMMFDQHAPIRFALWNFIKDESGVPDPHSPAWDWQFVIHRPQVGQSYSYRARMAVVPVSETTQLEQAYQKWTASLVPVAGELQDRKRP